MHIRNGSTLARVVSGPGHVGTTASSLPAQSALHLASGTDHLMSAPYAVLVVGDARRATRSCRYDHLVTRCRAYAHEGGAVDSRYG